jgi:hypothetical protein
MRVRCPEATRLRSKPMTNTVLQLASKPAGIHGGFKLTSSTVQDGSLNIDAHTHANT